MKLIDMLQRLNPRAQRWFGVDEIPGVITESERVVAESPAPEEIVGLAADVVETVASKGMAAIQVDAEKVDAELLERFVARDEKTGAWQVATWDDYVALRGFVLGFRAKRTVAGGILRAGARAELEMEKREDRRQETGDRRRERAPDA